MTPVIHRRDGKMDFRELVCGHMKDMSTDVCECAHAKETKKKSWREGEGVGWQKTVGVCRTLTASCSA